MTTTTECGLTAFEHETCTTHAGLCCDPNALPNTGVDVVGALAIGAILTICGLIAVITRPSRQKRHINEK